MFSILFQTAKVILNSLINPAPFSSNFGIEKKLAKLIVVFAEQHIKKKEYKRC